MHITMQPIGTIKTPFRETGDLSVPPYRPEAPYHDPAVRGVLQIDPAFAAGIAGIEPDTYGMVIFHFDRSPGYQLTTHGAHAGKVTGVFSTRSPHRPNGIGVSIVKFTAVRECEIEFTGVDMLDGTPLLDIKPYPGENLPGG